MKRIASFMLVCLTFILLSGCQSDEFVYREDIITIEVENYGSIYNFTEEIEIATLSSNIDQIRVLGARWDQINYINNDEMVLRRKEYTAELSRRFQSTAPVATMELVYALVLKSFNSSQISSHVKVKVGGATVARHEFVVSKQNTNLAFYIRVDASGRVFIEELY